MIAVTWDGLQLKAKKDSRRPIFECDHIPMHARECVHLGDRTDCALLDRGRSNYNNMVMEAECRFG